MKWTPPRPGKRAQSNLRARAAVWQRVLSRASWKCEGCGAKGVELQWCHVAGRPGSGACLGDLANSAELTMALCADDPVRGLVGCHTRYDRHLDTDLRIALLSAALDRLYGDWGMALRTRPDDGTKATAEDWLKAEIRAKVRELEDEA